MKTTSQEIESAKRAITESQIVDRNNTYPSAFNGYISSFGASLVQAGLLPTIIFFERRDSGAMEDRPKVIKALKMMLGIGGNVAMANYILGKEDNVSVRRCDDPIYVNKVVRAMTAMKLALRMFNKQNDNNNAIQR